MFTDEDYEKYNSYSDKRAYLDIWDDAFKQYFIENEFNVITKELDKIWYDLRLKILMRNDKIGTFDKNFHEFTLQAAHAQNLSMEEWKKRSNEISVQKRDFTENSKLEIIKDFKSFQNKCFELSKNNSDAVLRFITASFMDFSFNLAGNLEFTEGYLSHIKKSHDFLFSTLEIRKAGNSKGGKNRAAKDPKQSEKKLCKRLLG